jgi:ABC-type antimicrobial peptide transport system permease subunit
MEIVGVVADATYLSLRDIVPPTLYVPLAQQDVTHAFPFVTLSVRTAGEPPASLAWRVTDAVAKVDSRIGITFTTLKQQVSGALVQERMLAALSGSFAVLALLLSALGLYGVTAHTVSRRRKEIAIRIAIGAAPARVVRVVVARVAMLLVIGVLIGAGVSAWVSRFVAALLFGLGPFDPITLFGSVGVLAAVGVIAGWLPAYRASRIDPAPVLRES